VPRTQLPMLPDDQEARKQLLLRWTNNNTHAAAFLLEMAEIARLSDDIVDIDDKERQRRVAWLLSRALVHLPQNPFWQQSSVLFGPMINTIIVQWQQSDEYRLSDNANKKIFGFVMREAIGQLVTATASIIGGAQFAKYASDDFFNVCLANNTETIEDWVKEEADDGDVREPTEST